MADTWNRTRAAGLREAGFPGETQENCVLVVLLQKALRDSSIPESWDISFLSVALLPSPVPGRQKVLSQCSLE